MRRAVRLGMATVVLAAVAGGRSAAAELDSVERAFVRQAPRLIKHFKEKGYRNVGVLKFLVLRPKGKSFSDNVGTLNMALARRLEVALVLANDPRAPVGVIRNASAVAARTDGANHLSKAGRLALLGADYPLAWGKGEVKADAFVTGTAAVSEDLSRLTVSLYSFDGKDNKLAQLGDDFQARNDAGKLAEMGQSFVLRGGFDDGEAVKTAAKVAAKEEKHPLAEAEPPVKLEVLYDGEPVRLEPRDGKLFAPAPRPGQKMVLKMTRDGTKARYAVALKVNGENTIGMQRLPDLYCKKWVLDAGLGPVGVYGYQVTAKKYKEFRALSAEESEKGKVRYGADVGTITMTVFREGTGEEVVSTDRAERNARLVARADLPEKRPENYGALKAQLLADADRSLWGDGEEKEGAAVRKVKFRPDPVPVMSATVVYFKP